MPRYNQKITKTMTEQTFLRKRAGVPTTQYKAFTHLLFLTGCRVSEILALHHDSLSFEDDLMFVTVIRLKKNKLTRDKKPKPPLRAILPLKIRPYILDYFSRFAHDHEPYGSPFPFCRVTAWNICKKYYGVYPHYFRMNRLTDILNRFGVSYAKTWFDINIKSIDHYIAQEDKRKMGATI